MLVESGLYEKWLESYKAYLASKVNKKEKAQSDQIAVDSYGFSEMRPCFIILGCGLFAAFVSFFIENVLLNRRLRDIRILFIAVILILKRLKQYFYKILSVSLSGLFNCIQDCCSEDDSEQANNNDFFDRTVE